MGSSGINAVHGVENWMPAVPAYRPYCALNPGETMGDADYDVDGRNRLDVLNTEENLRRTQTVRDDWTHPCGKYLGSKSNINNPTYANSFDMTRLLTFSN